MVAHHRWCAESLSDYCRRTSTSLSTDTNFLLDSDKIMAMAKERVAEFGSLDELRGREDSM
jgi:hypothetical protein